MEEAIQYNLELHDAELSIESESTGHRINALVNLRNISGQDEPVSHIAMLRPIEQVRRMVHQQYGNQATLKLDDVFAQSNSMRPVLRQARIAARGTAPVLLNGEGGVGKNHMARAIHNAGTRAAKPFIAIDCQAVPRELLVSEMLGYGQDAEHRDRPSKFELTHEGTIFLDRIESLSMDMQTALLQIIETGHVMRLGSQYPIPVDVRIIAATSVDLDEVVAQGTFLAHLYYRFGVFTLNIPPLRERSEDIPLLATRFLTRHSKPDEEPVELTDAALDVLCRYPWPGNVRELEMVLERAVYFSQHGKIDVPHIPEVVRNGRVVTGSSPKAQPVLSVTEAEREAIMRAGLANSGNMTAMAKQLGIGRTTLWRKMKRYDIDPLIFK
jgi:transcriptional activator for dhaKLM operon